MLQCPTFRPHPGAHRRRPRQWDHGEVSPAAASAVSGAECVKILIPSPTCGTLIAGTEDCRLEEYLRRAVELALQELEKAGFSPPDPIAAKNSPFRLEREFCTFRMSYSASCMALAASMAFSWAAG